MKSIDIIVKQTNTDSVLLWFRTSATNRLSVIVFTQNFKEYKCKLKIWFYAKSEKHIQRLFKL